MCKVLDTRTGRTQHRDRRPAKVQRAESNSRSPGRPLDTADPLSAFRNRRRKSFHGRERRGIFSGAQQDGHQRPRYCVSIISRFEYNPSRFPAGLFLTFRRNYHVGDGIRRGTFRGVVLPTPLRKVSQTFRLVGRSVLIWLFCNCTSGVRERSNDNCVMGELAERWGTLGPDLPDKVRKNKVRFVEPRVDNTPRHKHTRRPKRRGRSHA